MIPTENGILDNLDISNVKEVTSSMNGKATSYYTVSYTHLDVYKRQAPFRYPGPNPTTREQAILMMSDTVEAASRSLSEYTEESISNLVNKLIDGQVTEGFFTDCPITFHDITTAKMVLIDRPVSYTHLDVYKRQSDHFPVFNQFLNLFEMLFFNNMRSDD